MRMDGRGWTACTVLFVVAIAAPAWAALEPRQLLGTLGAQGPVTVRDTSGAATTAKAEPVQGSHLPLLERSEVTTGEQAGALLDLKSEGMVGLRAGSTARVAKGPHLDLVTGEALIRVPPASRLTLATPTGSVRADAASRGTPAEARVHVLADGSTVVEVERGALQVEAHGQTDVVSAGDQAVFPRDGALRVIEARGPRSDEVPTAAKRKPGAAIFGLDPFLAGLFTAEIAAGTLGGLAASGEFDDKEEGQAQRVNGPGQGSPFRLRR